MEEKNEDVRGERCDEKRLNFQVIRILKSNKTKYSIIKNQLNLKLVYIKKKCIFAAQKFQVQV